MNKKIVVKPVEPLEVAKRILQYKTGREVFRIGISANLGGHTRELYSGLGLAVEEYLNKKEREYDIEVLWEQSSFAHDSTTRAANQLINRGAEAVIGHLSANQSLAAATVYADIGVPFFAPGTTHPELTKLGYDNILRVCGRDEDMADEMINLAQMLAPGHTVKIIYQENNYGKQLSTLLRKSLKEKGLHLEKEIVANDLVSSDLTLDDTILFAGTYEGALLLTEKLKTINFQGRLIFGDDIFVVDFPFLVSEGLQLYTVSTKKELYGLNYDKFSMKYREIASLDPAAYSVTSYLAAKILLSNISTLKKHGYKKLLNELKNGILIENLKELSFSPNGDILDFSWEKYEIRDGKFLKLE